LAHLGQEEATSKLGGLLVISKRSVVVLATLDNSIGPVHDLFKGHSLLRCVEQQRGFTPATSFHPHPSISNAWLAPSADIGG
jgi:hypothetical protein